MAEGGRYDEEPEYELYRDKNGKTTDELLAEWQENEEKIWKPQRIIRERKLKCRNNILERLQTELMMNKLKLNELEDEEMQKLYNEVKESRDKLIKQNDNKKQPDFYWITMRPKEELVEFKIFMDVVKQIFKKVWMKDFFYVLEQSSPDLDGMGKGYHLHALVKRNNMKNSDVLREIKRTAGKIGDVDDTSNRGFLKIDGIYDDIGLRNRFKYIYDVKESTEENQKEEKQKIDKIWRNRLKLENYYFNGEFFSKYILEYSKECL